VFVGIILFIIGVTVSLARHDFKFLIRATSLTGATAASTGLVRLVSAAIARRMRGSGGDI